uniref:HAD family hydrolase n=1 Tax=Ningiella ruwaisensis TaxID=2364274 RepID=UPI0010A09185|nr:Cof-type HAD-IIB family hydrolase [Ningiella ruwaisensis]
MELIFFDLDGTLLNKASELTPFTRETLTLLSKKNVAYSIATGRTMLSAQSVLSGHRFNLPHVFNNGVTVWDPKNNFVSFDNLLCASEISTIIECALKEKIAPFVNTIVRHQNGDIEHHIYHGHLHHHIEQNLVDKYLAKTSANLQPLSSLPENSQITNISMIGDAKIIKKIWQYLNEFDSLIAYSGPATEGDHFSWMDVHHKLANKGSAVENLKKQLGASSLICFGDSDNDLSMFSLADEAYATANAKPSIKESASAVIGHHDEDGVAHFLRERFSL